MNDRRKEKKRKKMKKGKKSMHISKNEETKGDTYTPQANKKQTHKTNKQTNKQQEANIYLYIQIIYIYIYVYRRRTRNAGSKVNEKETE